VEIYRRKCIRKGTQRGKRPRFGGWPVGGHKGWDGEAHLLQTVQEGLGERYAQKKGKGSEGVHEGVEE
jgi:hypothetical protein